MTSLIWCEICSEICLFLRAIQALFVVVDFRVLINSSTISEIGLLLTFLNYVV